MEKGKPTGARAAKRGVWFFLRTLLIITIFSILCYGVFSVAMNTSNLYIIATEGLMLRAECILQAGDQEALRNYYTETFLAKDADLASGRYSNYTITSFDYRVNMESVVSWPWSSTATMVVTAHMASLSGNINERPEGATENTPLPLPPWDGGQYRLHFSQRNGRWYIYQMVLLNATPDEPVLRTPDMRMTPLPAYTTPPPSTTPTARPTPTPTPTLSAGPTPTDGGETDE